MSPVDSKSLPSSSLPPAQPSYILRGHGVPIHGLLFLHGNLWLLSGDADGLIVLWAMTTKRPIAVWRAHEGSILGLGLWGNDKLISHGRDSRLRAWSLKGIDDEGAGFSTSPPVETSPEQRKQPWLLHVLEISTLNFCSFASLEIQPQDSTVGHSSNPSLLIAVPGSKDIDIDIYHLPSEKLVAHIPPPTQSGKVGMVMALSLFQNPGFEAVHVVCGYESGRACIFHQVPQASTWELIYSAQPHSQPILSLDVATTEDAFLTSGADAVVVKHPLFAAESTLQEVQTKHSGQQGLKVRSDGRVFATAGWDARVRVYSVKTVREVAVLKWHKEGCYTICFAMVNEGVVENGGRELSEFRTVAQAREEMARTTHWLAAGSKDGKISLWDVY